MNRHSACRCRSRAAARSSRSRRARAGVSLMEVLISIFVLMVGLLGVAALIPVGGSEIREAVKADRSAALGTAALREIQARRMLEAFRWAEDSPATRIPMWIGGTGFDIDTSIRHVMIDPLYVQANGVYAFPNATGATATMDRVTLRSTPYTTGTALGAEAAREIFVGRDDIVFHVPDGASERARLQYRPRSGGTVQVDTNFNPSSHVPDSEGNYSWMVMVAPAIGDKDRPGQIPQADDRQRLVCSVIVFYKRDLDASNAEVIAAAAFNSGGYGGGDVTLSVAEANKAYLERVQKNGWILIGTNMATSNPRDDIFRWYRVVAVGEVVSQGGNSELGVTVVGPDWPLDLVPGGASVEAVLIEGVVGVYTESIAVDGDLLKMR